MPVLRVGDLDVADDETASILQLLNHAAYPLDVVFGAPLEEDEVVVIHSHAEFKAFQSQGMKVYRVDKEAYAAGLRLHDEIISVNHTECWPAFGDEGRSADLMA